MCMVLIGKHRIGTDNSGVGADLAFIDSHQTHLAGVPSSPTRTDALVYWMATTTSGQCRLAVADVNFMPHRIRSRYARQDGEGGRYDSKI